MFLLPPTGRISNGFPLLLITWPGFLRGQQTAPLYDVRLEATEQTTGTSIINERIQHDQESLHWTQHLHGFLTGAETASDMLQFSFQRFFFRLRREKLGYKCVKYATKKGDKTRFFSRKSLEIKEIQTRFFVLFADSRSSMQEAFAKLEKSENSSCQLIKIRFSKTFLAPNSPTWFLSPASSWNALSKEISLWGW